MKDVIVKELMINGVSMDNVSRMFGDVEKVLIHLFGGRGREILA